MTRGGLDSRLYDYIIFEGSLNPDNHVKFDNIYELSEHKESYLLILQLYLILHKIVRQV